MKAHTLLYYIIVILTLNSCIEDRYPRILEDVPLDQAVENGEGEASDIPILPSFSDPSYSVVSRGTGIFHDWYYDADHWTHAPFHTFAYLSGSGSDYTRLTTPQCLLNDQTTVLVDGQGNVKFCEGPAPSQLETYVERFYLGGSNHESKYSFYTFFCDDLTPTYDRTQNTLTARLTLDGTTDLIHSYAYHTDSLLKSTLTSLYADGASVKLREGNLDSYGNPNGERRYIYSGLSASRGINPIFHLHHLLCQFEFHIQGVPTVKEDVPESQWEAPFLNILFDQLSIQAPKDVTLTVAKDTWTEASYLQDLALPMPLLTSNAIGTYLPDIRYNNNIANSDYSRTHAPLYDYSTIGREWAEQFPADTYSFYRAGNDVRDSLCSMAWLLPPQSTYEVSLSGRRLNITPDGKHLMQIEGQYYYPIASKTTLSLRDEQGRPKAFEAGHKYTITIYIYGDGRISANVADLDSEQWTDENSDDPFQFGNDQDRAPRRQRPQKHNSKEHTRL
ncbi:MAG: hypothetical protein IJ064_03275 [Bacteroidaceae bacterium]|nr:hypothetical protein [Bacteroidaceae bacterium]